jgi:ABC-type glutathione transport system ATPase component
LENHQEDPDVRKERENLERNGNQKFVLAVRNLTKFYGNFPAVKNLTFGVQQKECFGLLGNFYRTDYFISPSQKNYIKDFFL